MKSINILAIWVLLANLADMITTHVALQLPNTYETNNLAAYLMKSNLFLYGVSKVVVPSLGVLVLLVMHNFCKKWYNKLIIEIGVLVLAFIFTVVTINNILVITKCL